MSLSYYRAEDLVLVALHVHFLQLTLEIALSIRAILFFSFAWVLAITSEADPE